MFCVFIYTFSKLTDLWVLSKSYLGGISSLHSAYRKSRDWSQIPYCVSKAREAPYQIDSSLLVGKEEPDAMGVGRSVHTCSEVALRRGLGCRVTFCEGCWITWVPLYLPTKKGHDLVRMGRIQLGTECISKSWRNT